MLLQKLSHFAHRNGRSFRRHSSIRVLIPVKATLTRPFSCVNRRAVLVAVGPQFRFLSVPAVPDLPHRIMVRLATVHSRRELAAFTRATVYKRVLLPQQSRRQSINAGLVAPAQAGEERGISTGTRQENAATRTPRPGWCRWAIAVQPSFSTVQGGLGSVG